MDQSNDDWLRGFVHEVAENDWSVHGGLQCYAASQEIAATLDSNLQHTQAPSGWSLPLPDLSRTVAHSKLAFSETRTVACNNAIHVPALDYQSNPAPCIMLANHATSAPAFNAVCPDTMSTTSSVDGSKNAETICSIHRRTGSDAMSFRCLVSGCHRSLSRWPDFLRHYNGAHAIKRTVFWCPEDGCTRNKAKGDHPFPRKDKLKDHLRQAHGDHGRS